MSGLQPIDLPESTLIIGDKFPTQDETAYARESLAHRHAAQCAGGAGGAAQNAARYTAPEFRGLAGGALTRKLDGHHNQLSEDQTRHANVAAWLEHGAQNIAAAKQSMNQISSDYHRAYNDLSDRAAAQTWTQQQLRQAKDDLVVEAQRRIASAREEFDHRHQSVVAGVKSGAALNVAAPSGGIE